jgi:hypothetical protein
VPVVATPRQHVVAIATDHRPLPARPPIPAVPAVAIVGVGRQDRGTVVWPLMTSVCQCPHRHATSHITLVPPAPSLATRSPIQDQEREAVGGILADHLRQADVS